MNIYIIIFIVFVVTTFVIYMNLKREGFASVDNKVAERVEYIPNQLNPFIPPVVTDVRFDKVSGVLTAGAGFDPSAKKPWMESNPQKAIGKDYMLLDTPNLDFSQNRCSKSCCTAQWDHPVDLKPDDELLRNRGNYVPSGFFCNSFIDDSGCLCLTKEQAKYLQTRGGNST